MRIAPLIALLLLAPPCAAGAQSPQAPSGAVTRADSARKTLEGFASAHSDCREWSDGCATCMRHDDTFGCSTPGIACQPTEPTCRHTVDAEPSKK